MYAAVTDITLSISRGVRLLASAIIFSNRIIETGLWVSSDKPDEDSTEYFFPAMSIVCNTFSPFFSEDSGMQHLKESTLGMRLTLNPSQVFTVWKKPCKHPSPEVRQ